MRHRPLSRAGESWRPRAATVHLNSGVNVHEDRGSQSADGTWHRQGALLEGPSEVRAALEQRPLDLTTVHTLSNVLVQSSAGGLQLTFIGTVYSHRGEPSGEPMKATAMQVSRYTCGLSPEPDGWRIKSLTSEIIFRS
jgi:hypothetical protein